MQKNSKHYKHVAKTQEIEAIKILTYHLNFVFFLQILCTLYVLFYVFSSNYTERIKTINMAAFENHWLLLLRAVAKRREKESKILAIHKLLLKPISSHKQNISYNIILIDKLIFQSQGNGMNRSLIRIS